ncbi:hypothetical protein PL11201_410033 [Planktothrix sp. PCC 11201]|uniref:hypothetical protein n=1 Tax=Planktothrix sp. PCC 11201 TaxID=1729650 RepID=UPI000921844E|nr:hypothetical protein [Planktothrix sp. PCC 11201]SKB12619.1 hypothetical protein PL11201_410033 [Planktothrix sp. PCC 11201]
MVQALQLQTEFLANPQTLSPQLNADLIRVAKQIYHAYVEVHAQRMRRPSGVAINPSNHRSCLLFSGQPILLPGEYFIPFEQIEADLF